MDYYKILGLPRDATKEEIKAAFRKLALQFHPDRHLNSSKSAQEDAMRRFKELSHAYHVLSDDKKRAAYSHNNNNGNPNYYGSYSYNGGYNSYQRRRATNGSSSFSRFWNVRFGPTLLYFSSMDFVIHAVIAGVLIGSLFIADATGKALWERQNTGKSFEETMNALNQMKGGRTSSTEKTKDSKEI